jgi:hypothetical protein
MITLPMQSSEIQSVYKSMATLRRSVPTIRLSPSALCSYPPFGDASQVNDVGCNMGGFEPHHTHTHQYCTCKDTAPTGAGDIHVLC